MQELARILAGTLRETLQPIREEIAELRSTTQQLVQASAGRGVVAPPATAPQRSSAAASVADRFDLRPETRSADSTAGEGCLVPRCAAAVLAKQLCETHYRIMRRAASNDETFDPQAQRPARARTASKHCREDDCDEAHYAKGLCRRHYMAERSRIRQAARRGGEIEAVESIQTPQARDDEETEELSLENNPTQPIEDLVLGGNGSRDAALTTGTLSGLFEEAAVPTGGRSESLPTAEMVARVVAQYRGGLDRVAEVLGRNKRTLIDLLDRLDLMPYVARVREAERQRVESSTLRERLDDLLFREKLLEDLGCLKEVDDRTRFEIKMRCAKLAKSSETIDEVLNRLGQEFGLEESGLKRLIWRYDLRRYLRGLSLKASSPAARVRA